MHIETKIKLELQKESSEHGVANSGLVTSSYSLATYLKDIINVNMKMDILM